MMAVRDYIKLMRPWQWYKNTLVFLAILFVGSNEPYPFTELPAFLVWTNYPPLIVGFIAFCAVSSAGYIINDIVDMKSDAAHPEKANRPLPSGRVPRTTAIGLAVILLAAGLWLSYFGVGIVAHMFSVPSIGSLFLITVLIYIVNANLYNYSLRKWAIVDVSVIAVGFVLRAIAGTFILGVPFTSWLVVGVFFFALVLAFGKRKNELQLLGEGAGDHKRVLDQYTESMLDQGITMSATWFVAFYALYCFNNFADPVAQPVLMTVPFAAGLIMRYVYLIQTGSPVGRKPHLAFKDLGISIGAILFVVTLVITIFFWDYIFQIMLDLFPQYLPSP